jgi:uncharacterized protein HemY
MDIEASEALDLQLYRLGRDLILAKRWHDAIAVLRASCELDPHAKTMELLGEALLEIGRVGEAICMLAGATQLCLTDRAPTLLAKALIQAGDLVGADRAVDTALARAPTSKTARLLKTELASLPQPPNLTGDK